MSAPLSTKAPPQRALVNSKIFCKKRCFYRSASAFSRHLDLDPAIILIWQTLRAPWNDRTCRL